MTAAPKSGSPNEVLTRWNEAEAQPAAREILPCCGSTGWAEAMVSRRPFATAAELFTTSDLVWEGLPEDDWREAFDSHPRIGRQHANTATAQSLSWSREEQSAAVAPDQAAEDWLLEANRQYEAKFGRIFIVCASGRSAKEILEICRSRMKNDSAAEMLEAAEQQRQITQLRLRRWLHIT